MTPSPAIDRTARVARLMFGAILRPTEVIALPGGKGNNVARAASGLGALVTTTGFVGGHAGRWLVDALREETQVGPDDDLRTMSDAAVLQIASELERRKPGAQVASSGVRPRRRPWTYRDIWRLEAVRAEASRRGLS